MKGKLLYNLSANTLQLVVNQVFGLLIFFVLSAGLNKSVFGQINLTLAILLAAFNILSFGIDQIVLRKIASGVNAQALLSTYLFHVVISGALFYVILLGCNFICPQLLGVGNLLLFIGMGKLLVFFSTPFKQFSAGFERFKLLSYMLVVSNIIRGTALLVLVCLHSLTLNSVVLAFISGDCAELLVTIILFRRHIEIPVALSFSKAKYFDLIKEAFPQVGVVIFTSALARFDWIFIGLMLSAVKLAEYSFAYKIFEISTLPLLALAPLLVPRFTALLKQKELPVTDLQVLVRIEMILATLISLILYLCWSPVIDAITANKYGSVNAATILILCLCTPLLYLNNILWSVSFAKGHLKTILGIIALTFTANVIADILLIPVFKNEGAALGYLIAMLIQYLAYFKKSTTPGLKQAWQPLVLCLLCAVVSGFVAIQFFTNVFVIPIVALFIYTIGLLLTKQLRLADWKNLSQLLN